MWFNNLLQTRKGSSVWDPLSQGGEREEGLDQSTMWPTSLAVQTLADGSGCFIQGKGT